jgi:tetratricopeptide (TPR) repeat protein
MVALDNLAANLIKSPRDNNIRSAFEENLKRMTDPNELREIAEKYTPHTEISIPIYKKILELTPEDIKTLIALGFVFFLDGEDDEAYRQLDRAKKIDAENIEVLTLEAALTKHKDVKIQLYKKILKYDANNKIAIANLKELKALT